MQPIPHVLRFAVPGRISPVDSVLGRLVARSSSDRRQAASRLAIVVASVALVLIVGQYAAWAAFHELVASAPESVEVRLMWTVPLVLWSLLLLLAGFGYRAPVEVEVGEDIRIHGEDGLRSLPHTHVKPKRITRELFYAHYRRFAETEAFVGSLAEPEVLLLIRRVGGPIALELTTEEIDAFIAAHRLRTLHTIRGIRAPLSELPALAS